ncbi:MAG: 23S rRNA (guanosine(2251)-2'-O)-methyltransferase RlmB, partial [Clostridia bacterium]|nr:23S rRNA (guanosine(2251)-2'-O)-methyltransferase RlmB [Clostridia bacterium]
MSYSEKKKSEEYIIGRNAVSEALKSGRVIETVFLQDSLNLGSIQTLIKKIRENNVTVKKVKKAKLDLMSKN